MSYQLGNTRNIYSSCTMLYFSHARLLNNRKAAESRQLKLTQAQAYLPPLVRVPNTPKEPGTARITKGEADPSSSRSPFPHLVLMTDLFCKGRAICISVCILAFNLTNLVLSSDHCLGLQRHSATNPKVNQQG